MADFLFESFFEPFHIIDKKTVSDGLGGFTTEYEEGAEFLAAAVTQASTEQSLAEKSIGAVTYQITTKPNVNLEYHATIKRDSDGKFFRVISDNKDVETPKMATFKFRQCMAELWEQV